MGSHSFQDAEMKPVILVNRDTQQHDDIRLTLFPDGSLALEPGGWPHGKVDSLFSEPILLTPKQASALYTFFDGSRVRSRMLDVLRRLLLKDPATRPVFLEMEKIVRRAVKRRDQPAA